MRRQRTIFRILPVLLPALALIICAMLSIGASFAAPSELINTPEEFIEAINNAGEGDILRVNDLDLGSYAEEIVIRKAVTVIGHEEGNEVPATLKGAQFLLSASSQTDSIAIRFENISFDDSSSEDLHGTRSAFSMSGNLSVSFTDCLFTGYLSQDGAAIYADYSEDERIDQTLNLTLTNCGFSGNQARRGGAVYLNGYNSNITLTVTDTTFSNNGAASGGALWCNETVGTVTDSVFCDQQYLAFADVAPLSGGAASVTSGKIVFKDCDFSNNTGWNGGALSLLSSRSQVSDCVFFGNSAMNAGGAMTIETSRSKPVYITNCSFIENDSAYENACYVYRNEKFDEKVSDAVFTFVTFYKNSVLAGVSVPLRSQPSTNFRCSVLADLECEAELPAKDNKYCLTCSPDYPAVKSAAEEAGGWHIVLRVEADENREFVIPEKAINAYLGRSNVLGTFVTGDNSYETVNFILHPTEGATVPVTYFRGTEFSFPQVDRELFKLTFWREATGNPVYVKDLLIGGAENDLELTANWNLSSAGFLVFVLAPVAFLFLVFVFLLVRFIVKRRKGAAVEEIEELEELEESEEAETDETEVSKEAALSEEILAIIEEARLESSAEVKAAEMPAETSVPEEIAETGETVPEEIPEEVAEEVVEEVAEISEESLDTPEESFETPEESFDTPEESFDTPEEAEPEAAEKLTLLQRLKARFGRKKAEQIQISENFDNISEEVVARAADDSALDGVLTETPAGESLIPADAFEIIQEKEEVREPEAAVEEATVEEATVEEAEAEEVTVEEAEVEEPAVEPEEVFEHEAEEPAVEPEEVFEHEAEILTATLAVSELLLIGTLTDEEVYASENDETNTVVEEDFEVEEAAPTEPEATVEEAEILTAPPAISELLLTDTLTDEEVCESESAEADAVVEEDSVAEEAEPAEPEIEAEVEAEIEPEIEAEIGPEIEPEFEAEPAVPSLSEVIMLLSEAYGMLEARAEVLPAGEDVCENEESVARALTAIINGFAEAPIDHRVLTARTRATEPREAFALLPSERPQANDSPEAEAAEYFERRALHTADARSAEAVPETKTVDTIEETENRPVVDLIPSATREVISEPEPHIPFELPVADEPAEWDAASLEGSFEMPAETDVEATPEVVVEETVEVMEEVTPEEALEEIEEDVEEAAPEEALEETEEVMEEAAPEEALEENVEAVEEAAPEEALEENVEAVEEAAPEEALEEIDEQEFEPEYEPFVIIPAAVPDEFPSESELSDEKTAGLAAQYVIPEDEPVLETAPESEPYLVHVPIPESEPILEIQPEPIIVPEPIVEPETIVAPEPEVEPETIVAPEPIVEPKTIVAPEPEVEPKIVVDSEPEPEADEVPASTRRTFRLFGGGKAKKTDKAAPEEDEKDTKKKSEKVSEKVSEKDAKKKSEKVFEKKTAGKSAPFKARSAFSDVDEPEERPVFSAFDEPDAWPVLNPTASYAAPEQEADPEPKLYVIPPSVPEYAPAPEPMVMYEPEPIKAPELEPVAEPDPEPVVTQIPETVPESEPIVVAEFEPEPIMVPELEPIVEPEFETEPIMVPELEPVVTQIPETVPESEPIVVAEFEPEPIKAPKPEPVVEPNPEPVVTQIPEMVPAPEPIVEPDPEPVMTQVPEMVPAPEPIVEPAPEPTPAPAAPVTYIPPAIPDGLSARDRKALADLDARRQALLERAAKEEAKRAAKKALEEEKLARRKAEEEEKLARQKALEEEKLARRKAEEEEKQAKIEAKRLAKLKAEEEARLKAEAEKAAKEEAKRKAEEAKRKAEEERLRQEEAKKKAEEEKALEAQIRRAEEEAKKLEELRAQIARRRGESLHTESAEPEAEKIIPLLSEEDFEEVDLDAWAREHDSET